MAAVRSFAGARPPSLPLLQQRRPGSASCVAAPSKRPARRAANTAGAGGSASGGEPPSPDALGTLSSLGDATLHPDLTAEELLLSEDEALDTVIPDDAEFERQQAAAAEDGAGSQAAAVASLQQEVAELRSLLVAQAGLVQAQQRHIQDIEGAVGRAVVQSTSAAASATAAAQAAAAAAGVAAGDGPQLGAAPTAAATAKAGRSLLLESVKEEEARANRALAEANLADRRVVGLYDARYHSTAWGATPRDFRVLPKRIFLVRHAESEGNVDNVAYTYLPDSRVPLTARGWQQAMSAGDRLRACMEGGAAAGANGGAGQKPYKLFFYTSPYLRSRQTYEGLAQAFSPEQVQGVQEEVQLREQDFGNFQDAEGKKREKAERLRFGRFFYRFPNGESGADVYDRMTIFEDHLVRDINAGRFSDNTSLVLVTHGLALRVFLMRWFHWTVDQFMCVYNPPNAEPLVLERMPTDEEARQGGPAAWIHTKALYRLAEPSRELLKGCAPDMCQTSWAPRGVNPLDPADSLLLPDRPQQLVQGAQQQQQGL